MLRSEIRMGHSAGLTGQSFKGVFADSAFREQVGKLLKKCIQDRKRFLAHFDALKTSVPPCSPKDDDVGDDIDEHAAYAFLLSEALRPGMQGTSLPSPPPDAVVLFTTYHLPVVESHYSALLCPVMLCDFPVLLRAFVCTTTATDSLKRYPVFLLSRSMAQAEFVEMLACLAGRWHVGMQPHSHARVHGHASNGKLAIEPPRASPPPLLLPLRCKCLYPYR